MGQDNGERPLRSGELSHLAGVSTDTLRHYERIGVLRRPARTVSGYRQYPASAVDRVRLVRRALAAGFSLSELARFLQTRDQGGAPCREVRALASVKLQQMERQLADIRAVRDRLRELLKEWDQRLARTPKGERAGLLESFAHSSKPSPSRKGVRR